MRNVVVKVGAAILAIVMGGAAVAGDRCPVCRGVGGAPYRGTGCGPKVYGPVREPVGPIDQCDACGAFHGCDGYRQLPDLLAPWQLPPGRGFQPPEAFGYLSGPCAECAACGPRGGRPRAW
ncbi:MAG: hypothetical protein ACKOZU_03640 [Planctomycetaceae bacterium]